MKPTPRNNRDRGELAKPALQLFANECFGSAADKDLKNADAFAQAASDLIADIGHAADRVGVPFLEILRRAEDHYEAEVLEEKDERAARRAKR